MTTAAIRRRLQGCPTGASGYASYVLAPNARPADALTTRGQEMPNCFTDLQAETALRRALIHPPHMALRRTPGCFSSTFAQSGSP
jgi:hypothetical protein